MTLMITVNILLVLNVSAFFTTIAEAVILILAVLGSSIGRQSAAHHTARYLAQCVHAWRTGSRARNGRARQVAFEVSDYRLGENTRLHHNLLGAWIQRKRRWGKSIVPPSRLIFASPSRPALV